jgi:hypothetical protein
MCNQTALTHCCHLSRQATATSAQISGYLQHKQLTECQSCSTEMKKTHTRTTLYASKVLLVLKLQKKPTIQINKL